jgi:hypothetical protein
MLYSGAKRAVLDLKKLNRNPAEVAARLGYEVFDEDAELRDKLALGSSVGSHGDGLRLFLKSIDDVSGETGAKLGALLAEAWPATEVSAGDLLE